MDYPCFSCVLCGSDLSIFSPLYANALIISRGDVWQDWGGLARDLHSLLTAASPEQAAAGLQEVVLYYEY